MPVPLTNFTFKDIYDEIFGTSTDYKPSIVSGLVQPGNLYLADLFYYSNLPSTAPHDSEEFAGYVHPHASTEFQTYKDTVLTDGGVITDEAYTSSWIDFLKSNDLYDTLALSVGAGFGLKLNSNNVEKLYSIVGGEASQPTASRQVIKAVGGQNDHPFLSWDGNNLRRYRGQLTKHIDTYSGFTVYRVFRPSSTSRANVFALTQSATDQEAYKTVSLDLFEEGSPSFVNFYRGNGQGFNEVNVTDNEVDNDGFHLAMFQVGNNTGAVKYRAVRETTDVTSPPKNIYNGTYHTYVTNYIIGSRGNEGDNYLAHTFRGDDYEEHLFQGYHTEAQANLILDYLHTKYYVTVEPPTEQTIEPANFTATPTGNTVGLTWDVPTIPNGNQLIEVSTNGGAYVFYGEVDTTTNAATHIVDYGTQYTYRIRSQGTNGSAPSAWVYVTVTTPANTSAPTLKAVPNKANLTFEGPIVLSPSSFVNNTLTISGRNFRQTNNQSWAIDAQNVGLGKKLIIENCVFDCSGRAINLLNSLLDIEVRNCFFFSAGYCATNWVSYVLCAFDPKRVIFENNYLEGVGGLTIRVDNPSCTEVKVRYNKVVNVAASTGPTSKGTVNWLNLISLTGMEVPNCLEEWNEVISDESNVSKVEDITNFSRIRGTVASPITSRNNCIYRAFPYPKTATDGWSGSGVMIESPNITDKSLCAANYLIENNIYIGMGRCSYTIMTANSTVFQNNKIVNSGLFQDGTVRPMYTNGLGGRNYYGFTGTTFNNQIRNNTILWNDANDGGGNPIDYYTPTTQDTNWQNALNNDPDNPQWHMTVEVNYQNNEIVKLNATRADEEAAWQEWLDEKSANAVACGPIL